MRHLLPRRPAALLTLSSLLLGAVAQAQTPPPIAAQPASRNLSSPGSLQVPLEATQLPKSTIFYLIWRGAPSASARSANNLLALWDDPDFAPARSALAESLLNDSKKSSDAKKPVSAPKSSVQGDKSYAPERETEKPKLTKEEIAEVSSLLENPLTLGYIAEPHRAVSPVEKSADDTSAHRWNGIFFVYNRSGKEALLSKTILRLRSAQKDLPTVSNVTLAGISTLKIDQKDAAGKISTTYWAEDGRFAISTSEPGVFENVVALLKGKQQAAPLAQTAAFQEAQPVLGDGGILEFFVRIPSTKELVSATDAKQQQLQTVLSSLKLESVHSICAKLSLDGARTKMSGAVLGDTSSGTLFDFWEDGQATPASLAFVPSDAVSYTEYQISLLSLYKTIKRGYQAAAPQGQQGMADLLEAMAQSRLGMPLPDALGLLTGEFASVQTSPVLDPKAATYFVGIHDKNTTLKLIRTLLGERLSSERAEGDTTYLKFSLGGAQGNAGVMQYNFFHLAVTPTMILASSRRDTLQQEIARRATPSAPPAAFQAVRSKYPEKVNGLSYFDIQKLDWKALRDKWIAEAAKTSTAFQQKNGAPAAPSSSLPAAWLTQFDPQVVPRHLHVSTSASWKDAKGIHFEGWIE